MSRSLRATVVAATTLIASALTTTPAQAVVPEPIAFTAEAFYSQASHSVTDTATGPDGATYLAIDLEGSDFYWDEEGSFQGGGDAVVAKIPAGQTSFAWATTIGGTGSDEVQGIAVGKDGHVVITGNTTSTDFPTTPGALRSTAAGIDGFVVRLDAGTGAVDWSTLVGGATRDLLWDVAVGPKNRIWLAGTTRSTDFPGGGPIVGDGDATLTVLTPQGTLHWSEVVGGQYDDYLGRIAVAPDGDVVTSGFVTGTDPSAPVTELGPSNTDRPALLRWKGNSAAPVLEKVTMIGGVESDPPNAISFRPDGALLLAGHTHSTDLTLAGFPVQATPGPNGAAYLLEIAPSGDEITWGTYYGGSGPMQPRAIVSDAWGATYVAGMSAATNGQQLHHVQSGAGGGWEGFVVKFASDGDLVFSTYLGGTSADSVDGLRLDSTGVDVFASTTSTTFPTIDDLPGFGAAIIVGHLAEAAHVSEVQGPRRTRDRTPTFQFEVDLDGTRTQCQVDSGSWRACIGMGFTTSRLTPGKHIVRVRALTGPGRTAQTSQKSFRITRGAHR
ncbi:hypothetical protein [Nocardioides sp. SR21]|uniref:hypothetical protein n=1 Tax=Nocardioides sp. SR21 TaxID=2919501 RepID=UPI001FAAC583|nr:hypothetical protein [Nocardioides sp. SR21]